MNEKLKKIQEDINSIEFNFIRYINEETRSLGNYVLFFSSVIIFLNIDFIKIDELDLNGIKISLQNEYLSYLIMSINVYYFLQFFFSLKIDNLNFKLPKIINDLQDRFEEEINEIHKYQTDLNNRYDSLVENRPQRVKELDNLDLGNLDRVQEKTKELQEQSVILSEKNEEYKTMRLEIKNKLDYYDKCELLIENFNIKVAKSLKFLKFNRVINNFFPKIFFAISVILFIYSTFNNLQK